MKNRMLAVAIAAGAMTAASPAYAGEFIINFATSQALLGPAQAGTATITTSNTLTTSPLGIMGYAITGITGTLNGSAITGLSGFQGSNNYFYTSGSFVDGSGLGFTTAGGTNASLYFASVAQKYQLTTTNPFSTGYVTATATATPAVPEPAVWATLMIGFGGMGFALRRRKPATTVSFA